MFRLGAALLVAVVSWTAPAFAERISNPVAEFTGMDKITGRIITFDVYINETVQFGALQVTPRVCYTHTDEERPMTDSFVEVDEITLDRKIRRIFTGWMFAQSPGLNAVEHPIYDVWLKDCKQHTNVPPPVGLAPPPPSGGGTEPAVNASPNGGTATKASNGTPAPAAKAPAGGAVSN